MEALTMRPFAGETDLALMQALAHVSPRDHIHLIDLPYRLSSWALDDPRHIGLWEDGDSRLVAWVVLQAPFWCIDIVVHPDDHDGSLHTQVVSWARQRARELAARPDGRNLWFVNVRDDQTDRKRDLEAAGMTDQRDASPNPWSKVLLSRPLEATARVSDVAMPEGFTIRSLAGRAEVEAYVALHREAFGSTSMTSGWRARTLEHPDYRADLDLVVEAPDGGLAAFCILWFAPHGFSGGSEGQVEPTGVGEAYRRLGLGRAILYEGLRRLSALDAQTVYVETDHQRDAAFRHYRSAGFTVLHQVSMYRYDITG